MGWSECGDSTGLLVEHQRPTTEIDPDTTGHGVLVAAWRAQHAVVPAELGKPLPDAPGYFMDLTVGSLEQITVDESGVLSYSSRLMSVRLPGWTWGSGSCRGQPMTATAVRPPLVARKAIMLVAW